MMNIVVSGLTKLITKRKLVDPNEAKIVLRNVIRRSNEGPWDSIWKIYEKEID